MTIINFKIDDLKKKKIEDIVRSQGYKSVSEFIREAVDNKLNFQKLIREFKNSNPPFDKSKIKIPDFIPDGKYLGIARNEIVVIGDSIKEVAEKLLKKFPDSATAIIRKGKDLENFEIIFSLFFSENSKCYNQVKIGTHFYPLLKIFVELNERIKPLLGLVDTGASIMTLDEKIISKENLKPIEMRKMITANGIVNTPIYKSKFIYEDVKIELKFTTSNLENPIGINALIVNNFIDKFNLIFLGNEKIFCFQYL